MTQLTAKSGLQSGARRGLHIIKWAVVMIGNLIEIVTSAILTAIIAGLFCWMFLK